VFFAMIIETLGVGLLIPALAVILDPAKLLEFQFTRALVGFFSIPQDSFITLFFLGVFYQ